MKIDLHCHTKLSDGSASIRELIGLAKLQDLDVLAVTDHDTLAGIAQAAALGLRQGIQVVPGVEISAADRKRGKRAHILCYFPRIMDRLDSLLKKICASRREAMQASVQKVLKLYPISLEMIMDRVNGSTNIFKQHVMQALMDAGYTDRIFGEVFEKLFDSQYGLAYVKIDYPDVADVIDAVHSAGGAAVLAHPSEYDSMDLLYELCEKGMLQGAEAFHPRNKPEDVKTIQELCKKYDLAVTGGTDFHGYYTRSPNPLGSYLTAEEQFDKLKQYAAYSK